MGEQEIKVSPSLLDDVARTLDSTSNRTHESTGYRFLGEWPIEDELREAHVRLRQRFRSNHTPLQAIASISRELADGLRSADANADADATALLKRLTTTGSTP